MHLVVDQSWLATADLVLLFIYLVVWAIREIIGLAGRRP